MDESIVLNDVSLFYLEASEYINENIIDLGDDHQLFLEEEKKGFWAKVWDGIKKFFTTIWNWIKKAFSWLFGGSRNPGQIEKVLLEYKKVLENKFNECKKVLQNKDQKEIDNVFKEIIFVNLCLTYNWDLEHSEIKHNFIIETKEGQRLLTVLRAKAKEFVDRKLTLKNMNLPNKDNSDQVLEDNLSMSFEAKWNYINGIKELFENRLSFYENENEAINLLYLDGVNNITCNLVNFYCALDKIISLVDILVLDKHKSIDSRNKALNDLISLLDGETELTKAFNNETYTGEILIVLKFYSEVGFINANSYKKEFYEIFDNAKYRKSSLNIISEFERKHKISIESDENKKAGKPIILDNQGNQYNEYEKIKKWIKTINELAPDMVSRIDKLTQDTENQSEISKDRIMGLIQKIMGLNKVVAILFRNTQNYIKLSDSAIDKMKTLIKYNNL